MLKYISLIIINISLLEEIGFWRLKRRPMREEIPVAPVAKYLSMGRCVIKGRYCDASANVGIRGCYPLSLINDDVLATQLQLSLHHLALSVFLPYSILRAFSFSLSLSLSPSLPPPSFLSLSRFATTLERSSSVEADARPATTSDLHHPLSSAIRPLFPLDLLFAPPPSSGHGIYSSRTSRTTYNARYTPNSIPRNLRPLFRSHR